jgi:DHA2 family multidrug resistance protein
MLKRIDWLHVASLALFLGCLQYVLEEGPRNQWFEDDTIKTVAWISFVAMIVFFERSFFSSMPVLKLSPFKRPVFALACVLNLVVGFGLYSSTYLTPIFLGRVRGFSSLDIGTTVFVAGVFMSFGAPLAARLTTLVDQRYVIAFGFSLFALSCWLMSGITNTWGFWQLFLPQAIRGFAMLLCIVPAVGMALNGVPPSELRYASGLFNLMRNLGGAIGIATVTTWLQDFGRIHGERFGEGMTAAGTSALAQASARLAQFGADAAHTRQVVAGEITQFVTRASLTMAFEDVYFLMAAMFVAALLIVPFCKTIVLGEGPVAPIE